MSTEKIRLPIKIKPRWKRRMKTEMTELVKNYPEGATHYNFNGTNFPYEKHGQKDIYVWANGNLRMFLLVLFL